MDKKTVGVASSAADSIHYPLLPPQSATEFMLTVRTTLKDKPEIHDRFVDLMKSFQTRTIEVTEVIGCVAKLFRNYPLLLDGFNMFLPSSRRIYNDSNVQKTPQVHQPVEIDLSVRRDAVGTTAGMPVVAEPVREVPSLEFQNALNYVRKIKNRFKSNPEAYNEFLTILKPYQNGNRQWSENDVYSRISRLFENQEDLLREFAVLLPGAGICVQLDRTDCKEPATSTESSTTETSRRVPVPESSTCQPTNIMETSSSPSEKGASSVKEASSETPKKRKLLADNNNNNSTSTTTQTVSDVAIEKVRTLPRKSKNEKRRRTSKEKDVVPIDLSQCERVGTSYRAVPPENREQPQCSGRTALCRQVLNDEFVSVPVWREDGTGATPARPRRSAEDERTFAIEDQRFELDLIIHTNLSLMKNLDAVLKRMKMMSIAYQNKMKLDDSLGGGSPTLNLTAIRRLYGDRAADVMDGLKNSPAVCVPLVLKRLKEKDEEWGRAQMEFNKVWRKDNDKYRDALKALGIKNNLQY
ncbi:hypothetical protein LSTR_LSTR012592 [Laodelphax striatellus]|uniref:Histone deacetylase interacting domain-containing protein n=1 Tax=Laodelphax striatellus TaxID=195883 RepID=A0A482X353_LAOST|nr:hypothetical protein LSTR_LSTR012592 [Laodelphax striatellus]